MHNRLISTVCYRTAAPKKTMDDKPQFPPGLNIFILDDVLTTSTTFAKCSKVLLAAGGHLVNVLTEARVVTRKM